MDALSHCGQRWQQIRCNVAVATSGATQTEEGLVGLRQGEAFAPASVSLQSRHGCRAAAFVAISEVPVA